MSKSETVQLKPFTDEWVQDHIERYGMPPMAGADDGGGDGGEGGGQGGEGEEGGFVSDYLQNVPEDYRPHVEPYLQEFEKNANSKFAEHADYRKQWEPYEELGLNEYDPEGLQQLLQWADDANDPEKFSQWWLKAGQESGLIEQLQAQLAGNDDDDFDDDDGEIDIEQITAAVGELLEQRLAPIEQRTQEEQFNTELQEAEQTIEAQVAELKEKHGDFDENALYRFAYPYSEDPNVDAIAKGFEDMQQFMGGVEKNTVTRKLNQPNSPEPGSGPANTNGKAPTDFADAKAMAKERLAQLRSS